MDVPTLGTKVIKKAILMHIISASLLIECDNQLQMIASGNKMAGPLLLLTILYIDFFKEHALSIDKMNIQKCTRQETIAIKISSVDKRLQ